VGIGASGYVVNKVNSSNSAVYSCSLCLEKGHNRRTCPKRKATSVKWKCELLKLHTNREQSCERPAILVSHTPCQCSCLINFSTKMMTNVSLDLALERNRNNFLSWHKNVKNGFWIRTKHSFPRTVECRNQMSSDEKETCSTEIVFNLFDILSSLHNLSHHHNSGTFAMLL
jgi:hypothetical protein